VVEPPRHGRLLIAGRRVSRSFTQSDIDAGDVEYQSDAVDETMTDYFLFAVADGRHDGYLVNGTAHRKPAFFNILIQPASKVGLPLVCDISAFALKRDVKLQPTNQPLDCPRGVPMGV